MLNYCTATGLLYVNEVPFTKQTLERVNNTIMYMNGLPHEQFKAAISIIDNVHGKAVMIDEPCLNAINTYVKEHKLNLADDIDFE